MPAIKADAYGHGAVLMAKELQDMGIEVFCVACVEEGMELRKNGITGDILILGYTHPKAFPLLRTYRLIQTVVDYRYGKVLNGYGKKIRVHVKIDTGMHRLGERAERAKEIGRIFRLKNLQIEGIYTHLSADEAKDPAQQAFTKRQGEVFYEVLRKLEKQGVSGLKVHLLASYGLLNYPELGGDYARVGIALYGLPGDGEAEGNCPVKLYPVLSLKARIVAVKDLYQGESAGYGLDYRAEEDRKIAVLAIGYADGLPRSLSGGKGRVLIHGQSAPVVGRICMDQTIVDITGIPGVKAGETAVVIGRSGGEEITAYEVAEEAGTISNEVLSRLGKRLSAGWEKKNIDEIKK
jgi:alanine racemase